jgi:peroxiredoxin
MSFLNWSAAISSPSPRTGAKVAAEYQTLMQMNGKTLSDRTSFVIAPDGKILLSYTDRNPETHIQKTMEAVKQYANSHS